MEEEVTKSIQTRKRGLLFLSISLVIVAASMGTLLAIILTAFHRPDLEPPRKEFLGTLAWVTTVMLAISLLLLLWVVIRYIALLTRPQGHTKTEYVDAWSLAGERFTLDNEVPEASADDDTEDLDADDDDDDRPDDETGDDEDSPGHRPKGPRPR